MTRAPAQALAVRDGKIAAIGNSADIRALAGPSTRVIDLGGRTVIPGLIDSHIHAIRAGPDLHHRGALDRRPHAGRGARPHPRRGEDRAEGHLARSWPAAGPSGSSRRTAGRRRAEIAAAAPDHHVYIQQLYSRVLLDPGGYEALGIARDAGLAARVTVERDKDGKPTGWLTGDNRAISDLFDLLPRPTFAQKVEGTRAFFRALNAIGVTGVIDPGGYNLSIPDYQPLFQVWREHGLTLRVRYSLSAPRRGHELEDFKELTQMLPMGFGDDWLRFNGIGENVTWGLYNNDTPTERRRSSWSRCCAGRSRAA